MVSAAPAFMLFRALSGKEPPSGGGKTVFLYGTRLTGDRQPLLRISGCFLKMANVKKNLDN